MISSTFPSQMMGSQGSSRYFPPVSNVRLAERVRMQGSVSVSLSGGFPQIGKLIDMNAQGASVKLDLAIAQSKVYHLYIKVFHNGREHLIQVQGLCTHCTLSGRDFKAGFRFGPLSEAASDVLANLFSS